METNKRRFRCPVCRKATDLSFRPITRIEHAIIWCDKCHREFEVNISPVPEP